MADAFNDYGACFLDNVQVFLTNNSPTSGNKTHIYEIVNGGRIINDAGEDEISGAFTGWTVLDNKNKIEAILSKSGFVYLRLPYGQELFIKITKNRSSEYYKDSIGIYNISFDFITSKLSSEGSIKPSQFNTLKDANDKVNKSKFDVLNNFFKTTSATIGKVQGKVSAGVIAIQTTLNTFRTLQSQINSLNSTVDSVVNTIDQLISLPSELAFTIDNLISNTFAVFSSQDDILEGSVSLAEQNGVQSILQTSQNKEDETTAINSFDSFFACSCLTEYSTVLTNKTFFYQFEVDAEYKRLRRLMSLIDKISNQDLKNKSRAVITICLSFLKAQSEFTKKEIKYTTDTITTESILCYQIYGNTNADNIDKIRKWNNLEQNGIILENIEIRYYI